MDKFERAIEIVLQQEGGYSDDPRDPGGKTKFGITEAVARANGYAGEMRDFPLAHAETIYREDYWDPAGCEAYPWPLCLYVFDAAVNQGVAPAVQTLQRALDTVADGVVGPATRNLAARSTAWHWSRFLALRAIRYTGTRNFDRFGAGWLTRLFTLARET